MNKRKYKWEVEIGINRVNIERTTTSAPSGFQYAYDFMNDPEVLVEYKDGFLDWIADKDTTFKLNENVEITHLIPAGIIKVNVLVRFCRQAEAVYAKLAWGV